MNFSATGSFHEKALDRKANLAAIRVTAPDRAARRGVEIGVGEDEHGVFAAEFEHGGNELARAGFGDTAAGGDAAGEDQLVRSRHRSVPGRFRRRPERSSPDLAGSRRRQTACRISAPHWGVNSLVLQTTAFPAATAGIIWLMRNGQRIVPGADDADDAQRLVREITAFGLRGGAVMRDATCAQDASGVFWRNTRRSRARRRCRRTAPQHEACRIRATTASARAAREARMRSRRTFQQRAAIGDDRFDHSSLCGAGTGDDFGQSRLATSSLT